MTDSIFPVDARVYFQTLFGNREPITERDFSANELANIQAAIEANQQRTGATGRGNVGYVDYPKGSQIGPDYEPIETTLGRFNYRRLPTGELVATDRYDFLNDERKASVEDYERMGALQRAATVLGRGVGRTFYDPRTATGLTFSPRSILNELGDAYIGREGRDVRIQLPVRRAQGGAVRGNQAGGDVRNGVRSLAKMFEEYATPAASTAKQAEVPGYAAGGLVANSPTDDFDPARIDAIVGELHAMNAS